ncbi:tRNA (adenosine(37)-N6)-dimethylallyltransferase MiaA [Hansschlegelia sp.]|uniref:tRNA (adenosine(37)-N6)-dimethylallyltransferase MiaA n=1 Tax=Hansschlegelia sp. TaxID=2041892 RepID=UPI002B618843|nr:tRNA (adenosine(37)-N6)-dimethylallyltransferase MiaA [Hansschlegelia sp.]HVI28474.1 tRNA (adenosine(37)-N6)-dimethylallyltransferase MiaA [Hansschlegelia sp.]
MTIRAIRAVLIAGPTASGKSALALDLARRMGGAVVNADALQVYRDLRVLTARPSAADEAAAPHRLYGHVDASEPYGVGLWLDEATRLLEEREAPLVFVGGTGLYFEALTNGLARVPDIPQAVRARWRAASSAELQRELSRRDPEMAARLRPSDPQRLTRALEVIDATGRSLADWQRETSPGPLDAGDALRIVLAPERAALDARIAQRLEGMMAAGAAEEAERLAARELDPTLPAMKALGVVPLAAWRRGEIDRVAAVERVRLDTRRYAKRQTTWFRNRMADWLHVAPEAALDRAMSEIERRGLARGASPA